MQYELGFRKRLRLHKAASDSPNVIVMASNGRMMAPRNPQSVPDIAPPDETDVVSIPGATIGEAHEEFVMLVRRGKLDVRQVCY